MTTRRQIASGCARTSSRRCSSQARSLSEVLLQGDEMSAIRRPNRWRAPSTARWRYDRTDRDEAARGQERSISSGWFRDASRDHIELA